MEATQQIEQVGKETEAGIPDFEVLIATKTYNGNGYSLGEASGAVKNIYRTNHNTAITMNNYHGVSDFTIAPSVTSKVYKADCDTVQPHSIRAFMWQRIA